MKTVYKRDMREFVTDLIFDFKNLEAVGEIFQDIFLELTYTEMDEYHASQYETLCSLIEVMWAYVREFESKLGVMLDYEEIIRKIVKDEFYVEPVALPVENSYCLSETQPPYYKVWQGKKQ